MSDPYKKKEFEAFIKTISEGQAAHWIEIAKVLNVDKNTILAWKQLPEAQKAIQDGIDHALACMQQAGARDWKMWEAKLKMLGINPPQKLEAEVNDSRKQILNQYGLNDDRQTSETKD